MISVPAATTALTFSTIVLMVRRSLKQGMMTERVILAGYYQAKAVPSGRPAAPGGPRKNDAT
jgi:hypothetical protein